MPFYKVEEGVLSIATHIDGRNFSLKEKGRTEFTYPRAGWYWHPDENAARGALNIPVDAGAIKLSGPSVEAYENELRNRIV